MSTVAVVLVLSSTLTGVATVTGHVQDAAGAPSAGAQVFLEQGISGSVGQTRSGADGSFRFERVAPGQIGVFAIADGTAFGGDSMTITAGDAAANLTITLGAAGTVGGSVADAKGESVAGARISRVAIQGDTKVGIPLAKLQQFGFETPLTNEDGRFTVPMLPRGTQVALKIGHPLYAQEVVSGVAVGDGGVRVTLYSGVTLRGRVLSRRERIPVANAAVLICTDKPFRQTVITTTDFAGEFGVRLKPGVYVYRAASAEARSPGWERLVVTGERLEQTVALYVAGAGRVHGLVKDALTQEPIAGARLSLSAFGNPADVVATGPSGEYVLQASEGENVVRLESAPGYVPPEKPLIKVQVAEGADVELPVFWLMGVPTHQLIVLDENAQPVAGAAISIVRPRQFGYWPTDANGQAELKFSNLAGDRVVIGLVEHPTRPFGAAFSLGDPGGEAARVQLLALGRITGRVVTDKGQGVEGATVAVAFAVGPTDEPVVLWRTLSRKDGAFEVDGVVPGVELKCMASDPEGRTGESRAFVVDTAGAEDIGNIVIPGGAQANSMFGKTLKWYDHRLLQGELPDKKTLRGQAAVIVYCSSDEAAMTAEGLANMRGLAGGGKLLCVLVVEGAYQAGGAGLPVLTGQRPAPATTYLVGEGGKVVSETYGMPTLAALNSLRAPSHD